MNKSVLSLILILFTKIIFCQQDSISLKRYENINWFSKDQIFENTNLWKKSIVPLGLMGIGLSLNKLETKIKLQNQFREPFNGFKTKADDFIQYAPVLELYTFDLCKFKAQNSIWTQTKYLAISEVITTGIVLTLKYSLKIQRPENGTFNSFPSGHTAQAFVESQVLFNEFYQTNKVIAFSGFLTSISTGTLRVINNRHWIPDVLMGAGIGILVTNLVYYFKPLKNWNPFLKYQHSKNHISFSPSINSQFSGFNLRIGL